MAFNPYFSLAKRILRLSARSYTVKRLGANWTLYPKDWIDNRLLIGKPFEQAQLAKAEDIINTRRITHFYDCGANIGLYSILLGLRCGGLQSVQAFEPVQRTFARLAANLAQNSLPVDTKAHNVGLSNQAQSLEIAIDQSSSGTATLDKAVVENQERNFAHFETIQVKTFDSLFSSRNEKAFFKLDMEGHEHFALKGMSQFLADNDCVLQIEMWDSQRDMITNWLAQRGYAPFHNIGHDVYFEKTGQLA